MNQKKNQAARYQPRSFEMVLDFCAELSRRMIMSGANVERVNLAVDRVCSTYELDPLLLYADRDQPEKQRNGEDQRIQLRSDTCIHERRIRSEFRYRTLCPQSKK